MKTFSYLLDLLDDSEALTAFATRVLTGLNTAPDGPRPPPFVPGSAPTSIAQAPRLGALSARSAPRAAPADSHDIRQSAQPDSHADDNFESYSPGPPSGFPMGLAAYRALADPLKQPTLRGHLVWALQSRAEPASPELIDALMGRDPGVVCSCLNDPGRLTGAINAANRWLANHPAHSREPTQPSRRARGRDRPARPVPYPTRAGGSRRYTPPSASTRTGARPSHPLPGTSSTSQWRPSLAAPPRVDRAPPPEPLPRSPHTGSSSSPKDWARRQPSWSPRSRGPQGKRPRRNTSAPNEGHFLPVD